MLEALLQGTGDFRTPAQAVQRLGVTMPQICDLVNMKEIGGLAVGAQMAICVVLAMVFAWWVCLGWALLCCSH